MKLDEITYITSGKFITHDPWIHPARVIDSCEIIFVIRNGFSIREADKVYDLTQDDILILDKNTPHEGLREEPDVSFFWAHFRSRPDDIQLPKRFKSSNPSNILLLFRQLFHYSNTPGYPAAASDLILRLILCDAPIQREIGKRFAFFSSPIKFRIYGTRLRITFAEVSVTRKLKATFSYTVIFGIRRKS